MVIRVNVEGHALRRHDIQEYDNIIKKRGVLGHPALALIIGDAVGADDGEVIPDRRFKQGGDGLDGRPVVAGPNLEGQGILRAVIVYVDDRAAGGVDHHVLIKMIQVEAGILFVRSIDTGIGIVSGALLDHSIDRRPNFAFERDGLSKVVAALQILLPDNDRIADRFIRDPAGVDGRLIRKLFAEAELARGHRRVRSVGIGIFLGIVPAAEGIALAGHRRTGIHGDGAGLDELRRIIGAALAVLVEDQPVALRREDGEGHAALYSDLVIDCIQRIIHITDDIILAFQHGPAEEAVGVVLGRIAVLDLEGLFQLGIVCAEFDDHLSKGSAVFIQIVDGVLSDAHGIIDDGLRVRIIRIIIGRQHPLDIRTHRVDQHGFGINGIIRIRCPALEDHAGLRLDDRLGENNRQIVALFDQQGSQLSCAVHKLDLQTLSRFAYHVDGEAVGRAVSAAFEARADLREGRAEGPGRALGQRRFHLGLGGRLGHVVPNLGALGEGRVQEGELHQLAVFRRLVDFALLIQQLHVQHQGIGHADAPVRHILQIQRGLLPLQLLDGKSDAFGQLTHHFGDLDISPVHLGAEGLRLHAGGNHRHGEETEHHGQGEQQCKQFFLHCMFLPVQI